MGVYVYTMRKKTKNVNVDGAFLALPVFEYAYKPSSWPTAEQDRIHSQQIDRAEDAFHHHFHQQNPDGFAGQPHVLALDGEWVVLTRRDHYLDTYGPDELHTVVIGRVERIGNRLHCVAQETTVDLAKSSLTYAAQDARTKVSA